MGATPPPAGPPPGTYPWAYAAPSPSRGGLKSFVGNRWTQIVAALLLGIVLGAGSMAIILNDDRDGRRGFGNQRDIGPYRNGPYGDLDRNHGPGDRRGGSIQTTPGPILESTTSGAVSTA